MKWRYYKNSQSLEDSSLLLKGISEAKNRKGGFLSMLLATLGAILLGNMLAGKGMNGAGEEIIRNSYGSEGSSIKNKCF